MSASMRFEDVFKEVTFTDTEEQQDSSGEESDKRNEAIEAFTECSDLGENFALVKKGAKTKMFKGKTLLFSILNDHLTQKQS